MRQIRVLIVDDSVVVRRLVTDVLASDPAIEVVGTAPNGSIALTKISNLLPDVVTLDVEMPGMDGLATLREIRKNHPRLPVIMFSSATERGAAATIDALSHGASDCVSKTPQPGHSGTSADHVRQALMPKILALCPPDLNGSAPAAPVPRPPPRDGRPPPGRIEVLAIASSTGGPNALAALLPELPANFPVPIVIVQHMPPMFTRMLAEHLTKKCRITVSEAVEGDVLRPGHALIAPGDFHLVVTRGESALTVKLDHGPPENSCRPAADVLFRSVAEAFPGKALAVVLTGMGQDGRRGGAEIVATGGRILVQDEKSSVVWGMAGSVMTAGLADGAWPLGELAAQVIRRTAVGRPTWFPEAAAAVARGGAA